MINETPHPVKQSVSQRTSESENFVNTRKSSHSNQIGRQTSDQNGHRSQYSEHPTKANSNAYRPPPNIRSNSRRDSTASDESSSYSYGRANNSNTSRAPNK